MGLRHSKIKYKHSNGKSVVKEGLKTAAAPPEVSERQTELLKNVWSILKEDIDKVGVITFVR